MVLWCPAIGENKKTNTQFHCWKLIFLEHEVTVKSTTCVLILDHGLSPNKRENHPVYPRGMQEFLVHPFSPESFKDDPVPKALLQFQ